MANLIFPKGWATQPSGSVSINPACPFARGIIAAWTPWVSSLRLLICGQPTSGSAVSGVVGAKGIGADYASGTVDFVGSPVAKISGFPFTLHLLVHVAATSGNVRSSILGVSNTSTTAPVYVGLGTTFTGDCFPSATVGAATISAPSISMFGKSGLLSLVCASSTDHKLYLDGIQIASSTTSAGANMFNSPSEVSLFAFRDFSFGGWNAGFAQTGGYGGSWHSVAHTPAEVAKASEYWQLFASQPRRLWVSVAASNPTATSATTDGADVLSAASGVLSAASSATTDGADTLGSTVGVLAAASSSTTDGADTLSASVTVGLSATASSTTTDGADTLSAAASVLAGASSATTDGADALASTADVQSAASVAVTDGADTLSASVIAVPATVTASSSTTDGTDLWIASINNIPLPSTDILISGGSNKWRQRYEEQALIEEEDVMLLLTCLVTSGALECEY